MARTSSVLWPFNDLTFKCDLDLQSSGKNVSNRTLNRQGEQLCKLCINVQVMARKSSFYDNFIIWHSSVTLTFNLPEQMFRIALYSSRETTVPNYLKYMHKERGYSPDNLNLWLCYHLTFKSDLNLQRTWTNGSNNTFSHQGEQFRQRASDNCNVYLPIKWVKNKF